MRPFPTNIEGELWMKLITNCAYNAISRSDTLEIPSYHR